MNVTNGFDSVRADTGTVASLVALGILLTVAVYLEIRESRIPNWVTLSGMAAGLLLGYLPGGISLRTSLVGLLIQLEEAHNIHQN